MFSKLENFNLHNIRRYYVTLMEVFLAKPHLGAEYTYPRYSEANERHYQNYQLQYITDNDQSNQSKIKFE